MSCIWMGFWSQPWSSKKFKITFQQLPEEDDHQRTPVYLSSIPNLIRKPVALRDAQVGGLGAVLINFHCRGDYVTFSIL
ncbi:unnamed protein product [Arctogadus glacialis]